MNESRVAEKEAVIAVAPRASRDWTRVAPRGPSLRVLVVEDDYELCLSLQASLAQRGMTVETAGDGIDAAAQSLHGLYDVVVSDIRLPGMNGIALTRSLRRHRRPPSVILMTAYAHWRVVQEGYEAGATEVMRKPIDPERLAGLVTDAALDRL